MKKNNLIYLLLLCLGETQNNTSNVLLSKERSNAVLISESITNVQPVNKISPLGFWYNDNVFDFDVRDQLDYANDNIELYSNSKKYGYLHFYVESLSLVSSSDNYEYTVITYEVDYGSQSNTIWFTKYYGILNELTISITDNSASTYYSSICGDDCGTLINPTKINVSCEFSKYYPEAISDNINQNYSTLIYTDYVIPEYGDYLKFSKSTSSSNTSKCTHDFVLFYNEKKPSEETLMTKSGSFYGMFVIKSSQRRVSNLKFELNGKFLIVKNKQKFTDSDYVANTSTSFEYCL